MHDRFFLTLLRIGVAAAVAVGLFGQIVVIPTTARDQVDMFRPYAPYAVPCATVAILGVACVQVALAATWMLLTMVGRDAVFSPRAFRWVDAVIGASVVATLPAAGVAAHLLLVGIPSPGDGMEVIGTCGTALTCVGLGSGFAMLVVVMRSLLRKATDLQTEIAGVV